MSAVVFRARGFAFYFYSREEARPHIHVRRANGWAKFWLEPTIELARSYGLAERHIALALELITEHEDEIRTAWAHYFGR